MGFLSGLRSRSSGGGSSDIARGTAEMGSVNREASLSWITGLVGKALRYVAVFEGRWLALIGWQGAP